MANESMDILYLIDRLEELVAKPSTFLWAAAWWYIASACSI